VGIDEVRHGKRQSTDIGRVVIYVKLATTTGGTHQLEIVSGNEDPHPMGCSMAHL
jgi:hypothetical protein